MSRKTYPSAAVHRAWIISQAAVFISFAAVVVRTLARPDLKSLLPIYLLLELVYLVMFSLMLWRPIRWQPGQHIYFAFQTLIVLFLLLLNTSFDFITVLFVILAFEAALVFPRRVRAWWILSLIFLTAVPLIAALGIYGVALSLTPVAICLIYPAYVLITQDYETSFHANQLLLDELRAANQQLKIYNAQVEELSIIQEHNRLARELDDSVSQTIQEIVEQNRTARSMLAKDSDQLSSQLDLLQDLAQNSLEQMRSLIASLLPPENGSSGRLMT